MNETKVLLSGPGLEGDTGWHDDRLYFSDWPASEVLAVDTTCHSEVIRMSLCPWGHRLIVG